MATLRRVALVNTRNTNWDVIRTLRVFNGDLSVLLWSKDHGATTRCVAIGPDGEVAIGGDRVDSITTRVYDQDGGVLWTADHGATVNGIAFDENGRVYTVGSRTSNLTTRKYDTDGTLLYSHDHGGALYAVRYRPGPPSYSSDSHLYLCGISVSTINVRSRKPADLAQWWNLAARSTSFTPNALALGDTLNSPNGGGGLFVGGNEISGETCHLYNAARSLVWSKIDGGTVRALDATTDALAVGFNRNNNLSLRVRAPADGAVIWEKDTGDHVYGVAIDADGYVYAATNSSTAGGLRRYDPDGEAYVEADLPLSNNGSDWRISCLGVAVRDIEVSDVAVEPPGLPLDLALGTPLATAVAFAPGLPLRWALGTPTGGGPLPPFGAGQPLYRAYVGTGTSLVELPIISLQCRRRRTASTWMVMVTDAVAALDALPVGGTLVVDAGERDGDGVETSGLFLTGIITEVETEETSARATRRITARVQADLDPIQPRTLVGVRSIRDDGGRPSAQATVDPRLRPGDTVVVGADSWTAYRIDYTLSAADAVMNVFGDPL